MVTTNHPQRFPSERWKQLLLTLFAFSLLSALPWGPEQAWERLSAVRPVTQEGIQTVTLDVHQLVSFLHRPFLSSFSQILSVFNSRNVLVLQFTRQAGGLPLRLATTFHSPGILSFFFALSAALKTQTPHAGNHSRKLGPEFDYFSLSVPCKL